MMRESEAKKKTEDLLTKPTETDSKPVGQTLIPLQRGAGNQAIQKLFGAEGQVLRVAQPSEASEQEAREASENPVAAGLPEPPQGVRLHHDAEAAKSAHRVGARAYTVGRDIVFAEGQYAPHTREGAKLLAHELAHAVQPSTAGSEPVLHRETAREVVAAYETDYVVTTSLDEEGLALRVLGIVRAGRYAFATDVLMEVGWVDRDDVVDEMMPSLTVLELIRIGQSEEGKSLLGTMKQALASGWTTSGEADKVTLIEAILEDGAGRVIWNTDRIEVIKRGAGTDLEALAQLFEDNQIIDDGTVTGRLQSILKATEHLIIPGLQTGISFGDTGFRGEPTPTGSGFRDPHPSSANQVGHFLTAVGLVFTPAVVSRSIIGFGSIRKLVHAPASMSDSEVALRLTIGHEKAPDPNSSAQVFFNLAATWAIESFDEGPEGETEEERDQRIDEAVADELDRQIRAIIAAFRRQFQACTDADVAAWNEALASYRSDPASLERPGNALDRIAVDPRMRGNSRQDLRLSLVGWVLGEKLRGGDYADRAAVAAWIRTNLGVPAP
jgi:Domain of unknown function (DUF4157)